MNRQPIRLVRARTKVSPLIASVISGLFFVGPAAFARDSEWLLADDGNLAITSYEHRAGAATRETDVTLIIGAYSLKGTLHDVK